MCPEMKQHPSRQICRRLAATLLAFAAILPPPAARAAGVWDETRYEYDPGTGDLLIGDHPVPVADPLPQLRRMFELRVRLGQVARAGGAVVAARGDDLFHLSTDADDRLRAGIRYPASVR